MSIDNIYTGYIYLWYDTKAKFFYLGGHKGLVKDRYVCSSKTMLRAYNKRPETFTFKVLEYVNGSVKDLREAEQRWLDKIDDSELMTSENVQNNTCRYYNVKKNAVGGNGSANKGKSHKAWNKGLTAKDDPRMIRKDNPNMGAPRRRIKKKCSHCSTIFEIIKSSKQIYCSKKCSSKSRW